MASTSSASASARDRCFQEWLTLQELDLSEMLQALNIKEDGEAEKDVVMRQIVEKSIEHFQTYMDQRTSLASDHVSAFFAPPWCSSLETSLLWIGGCRPTVLIRLIYALSGLEIETQLDEFLEGNSSVELGELSLSSSQLTMVNNLQLKTIKKEDKLSEGMASLQEEIGDQPFASIAKKSNFSEGNAGGLNEALDEHEKSMGNMLKEADKLRLETLKELLLKILSPVQAVDFLAAGKKLHLCIHQAGKLRDSLRG